jgi:Tol biopolymer transport system component/serine/threonine protein kinase
MSSLSSGSTVSHYTIKELLGSGGMGEVYKAVDLELGRVVALKTILSGRAGDPNMSQRLLREARAASILTHPSICTIYEIGREGDLTFIAMQYVEGKTIQTILSDFGPLSIETTVNYAVDVVEALEEAHRNGVIHRDIKPSNIIANERNTAVVLDFGLAKQVTFADGLNEELPTQKQLTSTATLVGTGPYMPPEQIKGEHLDSRSDIFSFGVTLYEMLTGAQPFKGAHTIDVLHSILHDEPKAISELRPDLDEDLAAIVGKALKKDRNERYQSASEMRADLVSLIQTKGYAFRGFSGSLSASLPAGLSRSGFQTREIQTTTASVARHRAFLWPAVAVLVVMALIGAAWWIFRSVHRSDSDLVSSLRHVQLVNWRSEPGEAYIRCSLSRDGAMIAYSASRDGTTDIWVKQTIGEANPIRIATGINPIWSPDNQQLAFVSSHGNEVGIWRIPALGGSPALIKALKSAAELVSWSTKRPVLYYSSASNLFAVNIESGQTEQITNLDASHNAQNFSVSPDEDRISYVDVVGGQFDIWILPRSGGSAARITNDAEQEKNPVWHPDGKRIIFSSVRDDIYQVFVGYLEGSKPIQITFAENDSFVSSVSADGQKILYSSPREESDIWGVKIDNGEEFEVTAAAGVEMWPDISPDGKLMAFQATKLSQGRGLSASLMFIKPAMRGGQQLQFGVRGRELKWSPDGSKLSFLSGSSGVLNLWVINATGGEATQLTTEGVLTSSYTVLPYNRWETRTYSWSPDSKKIVYSNSRPTGECQLGIIATDGSGESRIVTSSNSECFGSPLWSLDGKRVLYASQSPADKSGKVLLADLDTGKSEVLYQADRLLRLLGWSPDGDIMITTDERNKAGSAKPGDISLFRLVNGKDPKLVARLNSAYFRNIQLSPDGRTIAFASHQDGRDDIWLIPTLGGAARKITANSEPRFYFSSLTWSPDGKAIYYGKQSGFSLISEISEFK